MKLLSKVTCVFMAFLGLSAHAANLEFDIRMTKSGGIRGDLDTVGQRGCDANPHRGCDFSDTDNLIRINDLAEIMFSYSVNDGNAEEVAVESTLPVGMRWKSVPAYCTGDSGLSGTGLEGSPSKLRCFRGAVEEGTAEELRFQAYVMGHNQDGAKFQFNAQLLAKDHDTVTSNSLNIDATGEPSYDLRLKYYTWGQWYKHPTTGEWGVGVFARVQMLIPDRDGKGPVGTENLNGDDFNLKIRIDDWPTDTEVWYDTSWCNGTHLSGGPYYKITSSYKEDRAVRDSGVWTCNQPAKNQPVDITVVGADMSGTTTPEKTYHNSAISAADHYVAVGRVAFWVPHSSLPADGSSVKVKMVADRFQATAASGAAVQEDDLTNNEFQATIRKPLPCEGTGCFGYNKYIHYRGTTYNKWSLPAIPGYTGNYHDGQQPIAPGQRVTTRLYYYQTRNKAQKNVRMCDVIDNTTMEFVEFPEAPGKAHWVYWNYPALKSDNYKVEYATVDLSGEGGVAGKWDKQKEADCGKATGWYEDIRQVPGGAKAANMIRMTIPEVKEGEPPHFRNYVSLLINIKAKDGAGIPTGTPLADWSKWAVEGWNSENWYYRSQYDPATHSGYYYRENRYLMTNASIRTRIYTEPNNKTDSVLSGGTVGYYINNTVTNGVPEVEGYVNDLVLTATLDPYLTYKPGTSRQGGLLFEPEVTMGTDNRQTLTWRWDKWKINEPMPKITYEAEVHFSVTDGTNLNTIVVISSPDDPSKESVRDHNRVVTAASPEGFRVFKKALKEYILEGEDAEYEIAYANLSTTQDYSEIRIVDVFPFLGDGRNPATQYDGEFYLKSVELGSNKMSSKFTKHDPSVIDLDPNHPANNDGTVKWCAEAEFGGAGCPANMKEATAMMLTDTEILAVGSAPRAGKVTFAVANNKDQNIYTNRIGARAKELDKVVRSPHVWEKVIRGAVGGRVFVDIKNNGTYDEGEDPAAANIPLNLLDESGKAVLGADGKPITTVTNAQGYYQFDRIKGGNYRIEIPASAGFEPSPVSVADPNNDALLDNNGVAENGAIRTGAITIATGSEPIDEPSEGIESVARDSDANMTAYIGLRALSSIGVAKNATVEADVVTLDFYIENFGNTTLSAVSLAEDLDTTFGAGNYTLTQKPTVIGTNPGVVLDANFNGADKKELLTSKSVMPSASTAHVQLKVTIKVGGSFSNQVVVKATAPDSSEVTDTSDSGTDPDPDEDGDPNENGSDGNGAECPNTVPGKQCENDPTTFVVKTVGTAFACDTTEYVISGNPSVLSSIDKSASPYKLAKISEDGKLYNALAYGADGYLYAVGDTTGQVVQIGADGKRQGLGSIKQNDTDRYSGGTFLADGTYVVTVMPGNGVPIRALLFVDVSGDVAKIIKIVEVAPKRAIGDIAFNGMDGKIYGYDYGNKVMVEIKEDGSSVVVGKPQEPTGVGAMWFDSLGFAYLYDNPTGKIYRAPAVDAAFTEVGTGPVVKYSDGTNCYKAMKLEKSVAPKVTVAGSEVTYTFTTANPTEKPVSLTLLDTVDGGRKYVADSLLVTPEIKGMTPNEYGDSNTLTLSGFEMAAQTRYSISIKVKIPADAKSGTLNNQAKLLGVPPEMGGPEVKSDNPETSAPLDPTPVQVRAIPRHLGVAKNVFAIEGQTVAFDIKVENLHEKEAVTNLSLTDDLKKAFPTGFKLNAKPFWVSGLPKTIKLNENFDGETDTELFVPAESSINPQQSVVVRLNVTVTDVGDYLNSAIAKGKIPSGDPAEDVSQNGTNVDPDGNGNAKDNEQPTPVKITAGTDRVSLPACDPTMAHIDFDGGLPKAGALAAVSTAFDGVTATWESKAGAGAFASGRPVYADRETSIELARGGGGKDAQTSIAYSAARPNRVYWVGDVGEHSGSFERQEITGYSGNTAVYPTFHSFSGGGVAIGENGNILTDGNGNADGQAGAVFFFAEEVDRVVVKSAHSGDYVVVQERGCDASAAIGAAKKATVENGNEVTFDITLKNLGNIPVRNLSLIDNLDSQIGTGEWELMAGPTIVGDDPGINTNGSYTGSATDGAKVPTDDLLDSANSALDGGESVVIRFKVRVLAGGDYTNHVQLVGATPDGKAISDWSTNGDNVDRNSDDDTAEKAGAKCPSSNDADGCDDDPTPYKIAADPAIGVAKKATVSGMTVTFDYYIENMGNVVLSNVSLPDDLKTQIGGYTWELEQKPTVIGDNPGVAVNAGFTGRDGNTDLLDPTKSSLKPDAKVQLQIKIKMLVGGAFSNQVTVSAQDAAGNKVSDVSDAGSKPDPDDDGNPNEDGNGCPSSDADANCENDATSFTAGSAGGNFQCDGAFYYTSVPDGKTTTLSTLDRSKEPNTLNEIGTIGVNYNAHGFRAQDGYIYAITLDYYVLRIDNKGQAYSLGRPEGAEQIGANPYAGDVSPDGYYYVWNHDKMMKLDVSGDTAKVVFVKAVTPRAYSADVAFNPLDGKIYGLDNGKLFYADANTGTATSFGGAQPVTLAVGVYFDSNGYFYINTRAGDLYKVDVGVNGSGPAKAEKIATVPASKGGDGSACNQALRLEKTVAPTAADPGGVVTYSYRVGNPSDAAQSINLVDQLPDARRYVDGTVKIVPNTTSSPNAYGGQNSLLLNSLKLAPQTLYTISVDVKVPQNMAPGVVNNQAKLTGVPAKLGGPEVISDNPSTPPLGDPTPLQVNEKPAVGVAKNVSFDNDEVTFDFYLKNLGNLKVSELTMPDPLDAVFGAGNYSISQKPTVMGESAGVVVNDAFDGVNSSDILAAGSTLEPGAAVHIQVKIKIVRGGKFSNQVTLTGKASNGKTVSDKSDSGTDPDPNKDGSGGGNGKDGKGTGCPSSDPAANCEDDSTELSMEVQNLSGTVFEDINYGGGSGRPFDVGKGMQGLAGMRVEIFRGKGDAATLLASTTTNDKGEYSFTNLLIDNYIVRVVSGTAISNRPAGPEACGACYDQASLAQNTEYCIPVQTFRVDGATDNGVGGANEIGGRLPSLLDAGPTKSNATFGALTSSTQAAQSYVAVALTKGQDVTGIDFGYNFSTIVSTNAIGQGSYHQFTVNANGLANTGLKQENLPAGIETTIFAIPTAGDTGGLAARPKDANCANTGECTIVAQTFFKPYVDPVRVDGFRQAGSAANAPPALMITLNPSKVAAPAVSLHKGADGSIVQGINVQEAKASKGGSPAAVLAKDVADITIRANYIGTNVLGTSVERANAVPGVYLESVSKVVIGGPKPEDMNVLTGNHHAISAKEAKDVSIQGNHIGLDRAGGLASNGGKNVTGVYLIGSAGVRIVDNKIANNQVSGIHAENATQLEVLRNEIGVLGEQSLGVRVKDSDGVLIGNGDSKNRNVIGGKAGIVIQGTQAAVIDTNNIGIAADDREALPGSAGVIIGSSTGARVVNNTVAHYDTHALAIAGTSSGTIVQNNTISRSKIGIHVTEESKDTNVFNNTIVENSGNGIEVSDKATAVNIYGNTIGSQEQPNDGNGIKVTGSASNVAIGSSDLKNANMIHHNRLNGVQVAESASAVSILRNVITANEKLGIDLVGTTAEHLVTENDASDTDAGPNELANFPVFKSSVIYTGKLNIRYDLDTDGKAAAYLVEFFANDKADESGHGEGAEFIGQQIIKGDVTNHAVAFNDDGYDGKFVSATATACSDGTCANTASTSEFSEAITAVASLPNIGVAKSAVVNGNDEVVLDFYVKNLGNVPLTNVTMPDALDPVFGKDNWSIKAAPALVEASAGVVVNAEYNGLDKVDLFDAKTVLKVGQSAHIQMTIELVRGGEFANQVTVSGQSPDGKVVEDLSDDSSAPDADGDGNGNENGTNDTGAGCPSTAPASNCENDKTQIKPSSQDLSGRVFEDYNYAGGEGRPYFAAQGMAALENVRVELYRGEGAAATLIATTKTNANGEYEFTNVLDDDYRIRVVNGTVKSTRDTNAAGCEPQFDQASLAANADYCVPVQTFRVDGDKEQGVGGRNEVGGRKPAEQDAAPAKLGAAFSTLPTAQSYIVVTVANGKGQEDLDFGYNFSTIVNTKSEGQGSLAQFARNANGLDNTGLAQAANPNAGKLPAAQETTIFMVPVAGDALGRPADSGADGNVAVFKLSQALPEFTDSVAINGFTQAGSAANTQARAAGTNAVYTVVLDGAGQAADGLSLIGGDSLVTGMNIHSFGKNGVALSGGGYRIVGNSIGTDLKGTQAKGNKAAGIALNGVSDVVIGTAELADRNLLSGNQYGVHSAVAALDGLLIQNNFIGTDAGGKSALGNDVGVYLQRGTRGVVIGGRAADEGNLISGNSSHGIELAGGLSNAVVGHNYIGVASDKVSALGNGGDGVIIGTNGASTGNAVGMIDVPNIIAYNGRFGINVVDNDDNGNSFLSNSIYNNKDIGINLGTDNAVTKNNAGDSDKGANTLLNYPILVSVVPMGNDLIVDYLLDVPAGNYRVEFFGNEELDPSMHGEGQRLLGSHDAGANTDRENPNTVMLRDAGRVDPFKVTATATRIGKGGGTTSEFSGPVAWLGVAKMIEVDQSSGYAEMTIDLVVEAFGMVNLTHVEMHDDLEKAFGAKENWTLKSVEFGERHQASGLALDKGYTGATDATNMLANTSKLAPGDVGHVIIKLRIDTIVDMGQGDLGKYVNQVRAIGVIEGMDPADPTARVADMSDAGTDPDPDGNNNPAERGRRSSSNLSRSAGAANCPSDDPASGCEDDPTNARVEVNPEIGVAKNVTVAGDGPWEVTLDFYVENLGNIAFQKVRLTDNLDDVFVPGNYSISQAPTLVSGPDTLSMNANFNGHAEQNILDIENSTLAPALDDPNNVAHIQVKVEVLLPGAFANQAFVQGDYNCASDGSGSCLSVADKSDSGTNPDPDGDGDPSEDSPECAEANDGTDCEDDATQFSFLGEPKGPTQACVAAPLWLGVAGDSAPSGAGTETLLHELNRATAPYTLTEKGLSNFVIADAAGYSLANGYIYAIGHRQNAPEHLYVVSIAADGTISAIAPVTGLSLENAKAFGGDMDAAGALWVIFNNGGEASVAKVNVTSGVVEAQYATSMTTSYDLAFNATNGGMFGFNASTNEAWMLDTNSGQIATVAVMSNGDNQLMPALWFDSFGRLYGYATAENKVWTFDWDSEEIFAIAIADVPATAGSNSGQHRIVDAVRCPAAVGFEKVVDPNPVEVGTVATYDFWVISPLNDLSGVTVTDTVDQGRTFVADSLVTTTGDADPYAGQATLTVNNIELAAGTPLQIQVGVQIPNNLDLIDETLTNQATVKGLPDTVGGPEVKSDDPNTPEGPDPTSVVVEPPKGCQVEGHIYNDADHNGRRNGEGGLGAGEAVCLAVLDSNNTQLSHVVPDALSGQFIIPPLRHGTYVLAVGTGDADACDASALPAGWIPTKPQDGRWNLRLDTSCNDDADNHVVDAPELGLFKGMRVNGTVFLDNGIGGGPANDGIQNGAEQGITKVAVRATCNGATCGTAITDDAGDYGLWISATNFNDGDEMKIIETNPEGHISTWGNVGGVLSVYDRAEDSHIFEALGGASADDVDFGDVQTNTFATDSVQNVNCGSPAEFGHIYQAHSHGELSFEHEHVQATPADTNLNPFQVRYWWDENCNGKLDEASPTELTSQAVELNAEDQLCVLARVATPNCVPVGTQVRTEVKGVFKYLVGSNVAPLETTLKVTDLTQITGGGNDAEVKLRKSVKNITTGGDGGKANPCDILEYRIEYFNPNSASVPGLVVRDTTPPYTSLVGQPLCPSSEPNCDAVVTDGSVGGHASVMWKFNDPLKSNANDYVSYRVRVDSSAACP